MPAWAPKCLSSSLVSSSGRVTWRLMVLMWLTCSRTHADADGEPCDVIQCERCSADVAGVAENHVQVRFPEGIGDPEDGPDLGGALVIAAEGSDAQLHLGHLVQLAAVGDECLELGESELAVHDYRSDGHAIRELDSLAGESAVEPG